MPLQQASAIRTQQRNEEASRESQIGKNDQYIKNISQELTELFEREYLNGEPHKRQAVEVGVNAKDGHVVADTHHEGVCILNQIQNLLKINGWSLEHLQLGFGCINTKWNLSWLVYESDKQ